MSSQWQIFVEGPDDRAFLKSLLQHLNISNVNTSIIGGGVAKLPNVANEIQRAYDAGKRIAIVLDANSDFASRCAEFEQQKESLKLPINRFFLLPNNKDSGCLETLLEALLGRVLRPRTCFSSIRQSYHLQCDTLASQELGPSNFHTRHEPER